MHMKQSSVAGSDGLSRVGLVQVQVVQIVLALSMHW